MRTLTTIFAACALTATASAQLIVGFNTARGGSYNLQAQTQQQSAIAAALPTATFTFASALSTTSLAGARGLVIATPIDNINPTTLLTAAEQSALLGLVLGGGFAIILVDSSGAPGFDPVNDSFTAPFGLGVNNNNTSLLTIINPTGNPISNGPFGLVTTLPGIAAGELVGTPSFPSSFVPLGQFSAGVFGAGYIPAGALGPGSGPVLFVSDSNIFNQNIGANANSYKFISNFVALAAIPEPATWTLMALGVVVIGTLAWRGRSRHGRAG
jgi:hypothetical protein